MFGGLNNALRQPFTVRTLHAMITACFLGSLIYTMSILCSAALSNELCLTQVFMAESGVAFAAARLAVRASNHSFIP